MNALLRPLRWPLNVQNALLAVVILAVTTVLTGRLVWRSGEKALLDHEIVDLKDETNLRSREFRDQVLGFAIKLRAAANALKPDVTVLDEKVGKDLVTAWSPPTKRQLATGTEVRNAEIVTVFLSTRPPAGVAASFATWQEQLAKRPAGPRHPVAECSPFSLDAPDPNRVFAPAKTGTCRVYLSCPLAERADGPALVAAVNVTHYLDDLWRLSPRVLYYLIDPAKTPAEFLYHPSGTVAVPHLDSEARPFAKWSPETEFRWPSLSAGGRLDKNAPAEQPYFLKGDSQLRVFCSGAVTNLSPADTRKSSKDTFRTSDLPDGGPVDPERVYTTKRVVRVPPRVELAEAQSKCKAFNEALRERGGRGLSYYDLDPEPDDLHGEMLLAMSHSDREELRLAQAEAGRLLGEDWLPKDRIDYATYLPQLGYAKSGWRPAVSNRDAIGSYTLLQTGLEGEQPDGTAPRLVVTASVAEIKQDVWIETFPHLVMVVLLSIVGGGSVALLMAWYVTRPLRQIKHAAWSLAERVKHTAGDAGADSDAFGPHGTSTFLALDELPSKGPQEVVTLADAFRTMVREMGNLSTHLRQRTAQFEFILNNAPDGVVVIDALGYITQANVKFSKLFGLGPAAQVIGTNLHSYLVRPGEHDGARPDPGTSFSDMHSALGGANFWTVPRILLTARRPAGTTFPAGATFTPLELGGQAHYTGIVRDITGELARQQELERRVQHKTRQLSESVEKLNVANLAQDRTNKELQLANSAKDMFMANVSHELRAPLTVISGDTQMLLRGKPAPEVERRVRRIYESMNYLTALVNDILDSMKIMEGKLDLNPREFDLPEFVGKVANEMRAKVEEGKNCLEVECPAEIGTVFQDDVRLKQVLYNLIGNASKFTKDGPIRVECRREAGPGGDLVHIAVRDQGRGMTEDELVKVRDPKPFGKIKDRELNREGTGLGLVICKGLCEKMGGRVTVESGGLGLGSTFTASFAARLADAHEPGKPATAPPAPVPVPVTPAAVNRRVLVVDDEPSNRELAEAMLTERGFEVRVASSDTTAIQSVKDYRPCAILLDIVLRDSLNGWAILVALKEDPGTHDIPVIIVSVHDEPEKAKANGADDWVVKPVKSWTDMAARIRKLQPGWQPPASPDDRPLER